VQWQIYRTRKKVAGLLWGLNDVCCERHLMGAVKKGLHGGLFLRCSSSWQAEGTEERSLGGGFVSRNDRVRPLISPCFQTGTGFREREEKRKSVTKRIGRKANVAQHAGRILSPPASWRRTGSDIADGAITSLNEEGKSLFPFIG